MTFRSPAFTPPTVVPLTPAPSIRTPCPLLGITDVPETSVPMKLFTMRLSAEGPLKEKMAIPLPKPMGPFPEMTLGITFPIVLPDAPSIMIPLRPFPRATVPVTSVPMKLPSMKLALLRMSIPSLSNRLIASPPIALPGT